jgi:hypothetical protein
MFDETPVPDECKDVCVHFGYPHRGARHGPAGERERAWLKVTGAIFRAQEALRDLEPLAGDDDQAAIKTARAALEKAHRAMD